MEPVYGENGGFGCMLLSFVVHVCACMLHDVAVDLCYPSLTTVSES